MTNMFTILYLGINAFNNLYEVAVRKAIGSERWNTPTELKDAKIKKAKEFQEKFLKHDLRVGFPNPQGGTSTTGNVVRFLFIDQNSCLQQN